MSTAAWEQQKMKDNITAPSLQTEGFIHCCYENQIQGVLDRYHAGVKEIVQLTIDESKIDVPVREEASKTGEKFPHVFGFIPSKAITEINKRVFA